MTPAEVFRQSEPSPSRYALLSRPDLAGIVESSLVHFNEDRFALHAWVVMPDHVHVVVTPWTQTLAQIVKSWKSFSARLVNRARNSGGQVWQPEFFDHIVRSREDYERFVRYVEGNPVEAGLCQDPGAWPFSSARYR